MHGGFEHRPPLDPGYHRRHREHDVRAENPLPADDPADQVLDHGPGRVVIHAVPVANRPDGPGFAPASEQFRGRPPDGQHPCTFLIGCHQRRFVHHDALAFDIDEHCRGAEIDANFLGEHGDLNPLRPWRDLAGPQPRRRPA